MANETATLCVIERTCDYISKIECGIGREGEGSQSHSWLS